MITRTTKSTTSTTTTTTITSSTKTRQLWAKNYPQNSPISHPLPNFRLSIFSSPLLFFFVIVAILGSQTAEAVKCHQCSGNQMACGDPVSKPNVTGVGACEGVVCVSVIPLGATGKEEKLRFCSNIPLSLGCEKTLNGEKRCACNDADFCNGETYEPKQLPSKVDCYECSYNDCNISSKVIPKCFGTMCLHITLEYNNSKDYIHACSAAPAITTPDSCETKTINGVQVKKCGCLKPNCNRPKNALSSGYSLATTSRRMSAIVVVSVAALAVINWF